MTRLCWAEPHTVQTQWIKTSSLSYLLTIYVAFFIYFLFRWVVRRTSSRLCESKIHLESLTLSTTGGRRVSPNVTHRKENDKSTGVKGSGMRTWRRLWIGTGDKWLRIEPLGRFLNHWKLTYLVFLHCSWTSQDWSSPPRITSALPYKG